MKTLSYTNSHKFKNLHIIFSLIAVFIIFQLLFIFNFCFAQDENFPVDEPTTTSAEQGYNPYKPKIKITKHNGIILIPIENYARPGWLEMGIALQNSLGKDWFVFSSKDFPPNMKFRRIICFDSFINKKDYSQDILTQGIPKIEGDTHLFRIANTEKGKTLFIYGVNERAKIIGGFYLSLLALKDPDALWELDGEIRRPSFPIRILSTNNPIDGLLYGYNICAPDVKNPGELSFYKSAKPPISDSEDKEWKSRISSNRRALVNAFVPIKKMGLDLCLQGSEFVFPKSIISSAYKEQILSPEFSLEGDDSTIQHKEIFCFSKPLVWNFTKMKYSEILSDFKEIDFVSLDLTPSLSGTQTGEGYLISDASAPKSLSTCPLCSPITVEDKIAKAVNEISEVAIKQKKRGLIQKIDPALFSTDGNFKESFAKIASKISDKNNLFFAIVYDVDSPYKNEAESVLLNPDEYDKIADFNSHLADETGGIFPNYIGNEITKAYSSIAGNGIAGVWNYSCATSPDAPKPAIDIWNQANIYTAGRLMWEPQTPIEIITSDYITIVFGKKSIKNISALLEKSHLAVKKAFAFSGYSQKSEGRRALWISGGKINGANAIAPVYNLYKGEIDSIISEKTEALSIVNDMKKLLLSEEKKIIKQEDATFPWIAKSSAKTGRLTGKNIFDAAMTSLIAEEALFSVLQNYSESVFYTLRWRDNQKSVDKEKALSAIKSLREQWKRYNDDIPKLPFAPGLFKDGGMVNSIEKAENFLNGKSGEIVF